MLSMTVHGLHVRRIIYANGKYTVCKSCCSAHIQACVLSINVWLVSQKASQSHLLGQLNLQNFGSNFAQAVWAM
jgi:hypothetical protein